jgi:hypothetical protein
VSKKEEKEENKQGPKHIVTKHDNKEGMANINRPRIIQLKLKDSKLAIHIQTGLINNIQSS